MAIRNPLSRIKPDIMRSVRIVVFPASTYTRPGSGSVVGQNNNSGVWQPYSLLSVHPLEEDGHFRLSEES
jgi:hypothetical protein